MASNPYQVVIDVLKDNWDSGNTNGIIPIFREITDQKGFHFGQSRDWIFIHRSLPLREPAGVGTGAKHKHENMRIDVRSKGDEAHFLNVVAEVERVMDSKINVFLVDTNWTQMLTDGDWEDKSDKGQNTWRMLIPVKLSAYAQAR